MLSDPGAERVVGEGWADASTPAIFSLNQPLALVARRRSFTG